MKICLKLSFFFFFKTKTKKNTDIQRCFPLTFIIHVLNRAMYLHWLKIHGVRRVGVLWGFLVRNGSLIVIF